MSVGNRKKAAISIVQSGLLPELNDLCVTEAILLLFHCLTNDISYRRSVLLRLLELYHRSYIPAIEFLWKQITTRHEPRKLLVFCFCFFLQTCSPIRIWSEFRGVAEE